MAFGGGGDGGGGDNDDYYSGVCERRPEEYASARCIARRVGSSEIERSSDAARALYFLR